MMLSSRAQSRELNYLIVELVVTCKEYEYALDNDSPSGANSYFRETWTLGVRKCTHENRF